MKGKKFGAPPKKGPNSQVPPVKLFKGGPSGSNTFKEQTGGKMFKALEKMFKEDEDLRKKTMELYGDLSGATPSYSGVFGAYTPTKEASGLTTKETMGIKYGRLIEPKLKKRKRYGNRSEYSKTIKTEKGYTNVPSMYGGQEYDEDFLTELYKDNKTDPETGRRVKTYRTPEEATVAAKRRSSRLKEGGFNPEGSGYDYKNAPEPSYKQLGYFPKYGSLDPKTGMVLKGRKHPTYKKTEEAEKKLGNKIIKKGERYFSVKKKQEGGMTGCPHRENGVKSDIKGISDIQVKGKKFIGVK